MRAVQMSTFGGPEVLVLSELADLSPGPGQVRIAVEACGVHLVDTTIRSGAPGPIPPPDLPTVPGREVAGVVDAVGAAADAGWLGARVVAHLGPVPGGYADQAVTSVEQLIRLDDDVPFVDAVALVGTGRTARAVVELEPPSAGETALVLSAAGGLGWLLVQSASSAGARVVAAAGGPDKVRLLEKLGPALAVDYGLDGWADSVREHVGAVDVVYDGVGGDLGRAALELLAPGGRLVMYGFASGAPTRFDTGDVVSRSLSVSWRLGPADGRASGRVQGPRRARARVVATTATWRPLVTTYPLADAARAHADLEQRRTTGKVVLVPTMSPGAGVGPLLHADRGGPHE